MSGNRLCRVRAKAAPPPNGTAEVIRHVLNDMRNTDSKWSLYDVVLIADSERFPVHRALLAEVSPFFAALFGNGMKESEEMEVKIEEVNKEAFRHVLDFIYGMPVTLNDIDFGLEVLELAFRFQLDTLEDTVVYWLHDSVKSNRKNYAKILAAADGYQLNGIVHEIESSVGNYFHAMHAEQVELFTAAKAFGVKPVLGAVVANMKRNFDTMHRTEVMKHLEFKQMTEIVCHVLRGSKTTRHHFAMVPILQLFHAIANWSSHRDTHDDTDEAREMDNMREKQAHHLLGFLAIHHASVPDLKIIRDHELTKSNRNFHKEVKVAISNLSSNRRNFCR